MKKIIAVLFLFFIQFVLYNCNPCKSGSVSDSKLVLDKISLKKSYIIKSNALLSTHSSDTVLIQAKDSVYFNLNLDFREVNNYNFNNSNMLMACEPEMPFQEIRYDSIRIITLSDFDLEKKAGDDISSYFALSSNTYGRYESTKSLNKILNQLYGTMNFYLVLTKKPTYKPIQFKVVLYNANPNDIMETMSSNLYFL